jgi:hypothetical protein
MADGPGIGEGSPAKTPPEDTHSNVVRLNFEGKPQKLTDAQVDEERTIHHQRRKFSSKIKRGIRLAKDEFLDIFSTTTLPSFDSLQDLIDEYPDGTVQVRTIVKDQPRHRLTVTNRVEVFETNDTNKEAEGTYGEEFTVDTINKEYSPKLLISDFVLTAMDRIDKLQEGSSNPNQNVIYVGPNDRIYNLSIPKHRDDFEDLRETMVDQGARVAPMPTPRESR